MQGLGDHRDEVWRTHEFLTLKEFTVYVQGILCLYNTMNVLGGSNKRVVCLFVCLKCYENAEEIGTKTAEWD